MLDTLAKTALRLCGANQVVVYQRHYAGQLALVALNTGKRSDYDSARRFLSQAEAAVKDNNLLLAESSVEKAETLANGLR